MSVRHLIDTNLIVRYLVQDHETHAKAATKLFEACDRGAVTLIILPVVLSECVFVLESFYKHPRASIAKVLADLIASPGIEIDDRDIVTDALKRYGRTKLHFVDCILAAFAAALKKPVATFDADFKKFPDVQIANPLLDL